MSSPVAKNIILFSNPFPADVPHKLAGQTLLDGAPVRRRVEVRKRNTGDYVISTVTQDDGVFEFKHLPEQTVGDPYIITIFNDDSTTPTQSISLDYIYQVAENGNPPSGAE